MGIGPAPLSHQKQLATEILFTLKIYFIVDSDCVTVYTCDTHFLNSDSTTGMLKADFKFTNLVKIEYYALILNHHLKSWLALQELHIGGEFVSVLFSAALQIVLLQTCCRKPE